ncbi:hypothetical protein EYF80_013470 [Liparis tanakae]|uniref:Uncharacterized protein n=1 Tax=Liparis tanakae TaxID=230148 RepID=A0A4Z2IFW2_9TELE|nr:hypothetical protein EYF80_013470 [Liparis tanakae]
MWPDAHFNIQFYLSVSAGLRNAKRNTLSLSSKVARARVTLEPGGMQVRPDSRASGESCLKRKGEGALEPQERSCNRPEPLLSP